MKVLIADHHPVLRKGLRRILEAEFHQIEVAEAATCCEVTALFKAHKWDLLIMDFNVCENRSIELLMRLKNEKEKVRVLVFSVCPEARMATCAMRAGACGYLCKTADKEQIVEAVRMILNGRKYISPAVAEEMAEQIVFESNLRPHQLLSAREYQTALLLADGKTVTRIAHELSLSIPTVSTYRSRILEKMRLKNNAELVSYMIQHELVTPPSVSCSL